jgi:hypothetical protein
MKVAYIVNTINRSELTPKVTAHNLRISGLKASETLIIVTDNGSTEKPIREWGMKFADVYIDNGVNIGNPQALNNALAIARSHYCDYFVVAGNDIELKEGWATHSIREFSSNPKLGLLGFDWRNSKGDIKGRVRMSDSVFGTWMFPFKTLEKCGYFSTFSKYGWWDGEFQMRVTKNGFEKGYLVGFDSYHRGNDMGEQSPYRKMKSEEMAKAVKAGAPSRSNSNISYVNRLNDAE